MRPCGASEEFETMVAAATQMDTMPPPWLTAPVGRAFPLTLAGGARAPAVRVDRKDQLSAAAAALGLSGPVLVIVGGADRMDDGELNRVEPLFRQVIVPFAEQRSAIVIDGGTDSGVMRLIGRVRGNSSVPLVGVVAAELAAESPDSASDAAPLEPNHSHFLFVPGTKWGDESPWLARFATVVANGRPSATVLVNGGDVTLGDAEQSVGAGRRVIAVSGSGRAADALADAARSGAADDRARNLAASGLVDVTDAAGIRSLLDELFAGETG
jgi:hypothetical protein